MSKLGASQEVLLSWPTRFRLVVLLTFHMAQEDLQGFVKSVVQLGTPKHSYELQQSINTIAICCVYYCNCRLYCHVIDIVISIHCAAIGNGWRILICHACVAKFCGTIVLHEDRTFEPRAQIVINFFLQDLSSGDDDDDDDCATTQPHSWPRRFQVAKVTITMIPSIPRLQTTVMMIVALPPESNRSLIQQLSRQPMCRICFIEVVLQTAAATTTTKRLGSAE